MVKVGYSVGMDSIRFILPKSIALKFLTKIELISKLRITTRNKQVQHYCKEKFKNKDSKNEKYPFKIRYINLKRGVKSLSNTILFIENSKELHTLARKNKKKLNFYVEIVFAGLHQPSKDIEDCVFKVLSKFVKRFKASSFDLALDFDSSKEITYKLKEWFGNASKKWSGGEIISIGKSLYANKIIDSSKYFNLNRILLYDKYHKQKYYHKERIPDKFINWKRLELTFSLHSKFLNQVENESINEAIEVLNDIARSIGATALFGGNIEILSKQVQMLLDLRHRHKFKAWIRQAS